ncbi:MAG: single-stranded DNA-binding protein [Bacteroidota bacterium]
MNKIQFIGFAGKDAEVFQVGENEKVTFSVAVNEGYKNKAGDWVDDTQWYDIEVWGRMVNRAKQVSRGDQVFIEGKHRSRDWEDKEGRKRRSWVVKGLFLENFGPREKKEEVSTSATQAQPATTSTATNEDEDLPF